MYTYMNMDMDMEMLFDLLGSELSAYKEWKEWISIIAQEKNRSHIEDFKNYMSRRLNDEIQRGYREDGLDMSYNLFFPLWKTDFRSEIISLKNSYSLHDSFPKKKRKKCIFY